MNTSKYIITHQELLCTTHKTPNVVWNTCDVCNKEMGKTHYTITKPYELATKINWVCSEECANMYIFQTMG